ncbi:hypothetical protein JTB14_029116 [Gonioctena quinquepunctata]|nr:hypothetical protein JTB14_029116 [Gonioctena quinquepunctata]
MSRFSKNYQGRGSALTNMRFEVPGKADYVSNSRYADMEASTIHESHERFTEQTGRGSQRRGVPINSTISSDNKISEKMMEML